MTRVGGMAQDAPEGWFDNVLQVMPFFLFGKSFCSGACSTIRRLERIGINGKERQRHRICLGDAAAEREITALQQVATMRDG